MSARRPLAIAAALAAAAIAPVSASAATTWFGSSLNHEPANAGSTCTPAVSCTRVGSYYPGTSGRVKAPATGTLVKVRVLAQQAGSFRVVVVRLRNVSANHKHGQAKLVARSRVLRAKGPGPDAVTVPVESFTLSMRVHRGDSIGIETRRNVFEYCTDGTPGQLTFAPVLSGTAFRSANGLDTCLLTVQGVIKVA